MSAHIQQYSTQADYNAGDHLYPNVSLVGSALIYVKDAPTPPTPPTPQGDEMATLSVQVGQEIVDVPVYSAEAGDCGLFGDDIDSALPTGTSVADVVGIYFSPDACLIEGFNMEGSETLLETIDFEPETTYGSFEFSAEAFKGCSALTVINTGEDNGITFDDLNIGSYAFEGCTSLNEVYFTATTSLYIAERAFADCSSLSSVTLAYDGVVVLGNEAFDGCHQDLTIYVPLDYLNDYKNNYSEYHFEEYNPK